MWSESLDNRQDTFLEDAPEFILLEAYLHLELIWGADAVMQEVEAASGRSTIFIDSTAA